MQSCLTVAAASSAWDAARAVALTSVEAFAAAEDFPRFAHAVLASVASCSGRVVLTRAGKASLDFASQLTHFRLAVFEQNWSEAKHLADKLQQVVSGPTTPSPAGRWGPELDAFALFLEQWIACRYLEFAVSACSLPAALGTLPVAELALRC